LPLTARVGNGRINYWFAPTIDARQPVPGHEADAGVGQVDSDRAGVEIGVAVDHRAVVLGILPTGDDDPHVGREASGDGRSESAVEHEWRLFPDCLTCLGIERHPRSATSQSIRSVTTRNTLHQQVVGTQATLVAEYCFG
jgi:hypothetical protein